MAISSPSKLWSARSWSAYGDNDLNIPQKTADLLVLWNVALFAPQNTPSVLLNNPVNILKNIIEGCSLSQRQSGQICCPSACEADGGALSAECQSMTTLQRASGWPSHHQRHLSGTLVVSQQVSQKTRLLLPHLQRSWAPPAVLLWSQQVWLFSCTFQIKCNRTQHDSHWNVHTVNLCV